MSKSIGILGGTFDIIHDGHRALFITAFDEGDHVIIGVTSDILANKNRDRPVTPFKERVERLEDECKTYQNIFNATFETVKIEDPLRLAIDSDADFIVLSPEHKTHERAAKINLKRVQQKKNRLKIIEAPFVQDYQEQKISSTRILNGEIDEHGDEVQT